MKYSKIMLFAFLPVVALSLTFCELMKTTDDDDNSGSTLTITHNGVDWSSAQTTDVDWEDADGETIGWCEPGTRIDAITGLWYRSFNDNVYRVGNVDLSSVSSVNTNGWSSDVCSTPLANGDVWVAECKDGYVKFKVIDQGTLNSQNWEVEVEYEFSIDGNF